MTHLQEDCMSHRIPGSVTALLISAIACQPAAKTETATMGAASEAAAPAGLSAADEAAVRAVDQSWAKAATAGDANAVGALYAGDATVMPPGMAAVKGDAGKFWSDFFGSMNVQAELSTTAVEGRGDLAFASGTYRMTLTPKKPGAKPYPTEEGKYLEVLKKQADGSWKIAYDIWNASASVASK
jgi:uncharacterized protein (TIGR02246 family)